MFRAVSIAIVGICCCHYGYGQIERLYAVKNEDSFDTVNFSLKATSAAFHIKPSHHADPVTIYGSPDFSSVKPSFHTDIDKGINRAALKLENDKAGGLSHSIAYSVFGFGEKKNKNLWKIYLNEQKIYKLNLGYGVGSAEINLSGLPVSHLKIRTGGADVNVKYDGSKANLCAMDTFLIKVDWGSIQARNVNLSRAGHIIADIGFGNAVLDFNENAKDKCRVNASIGAGNLIVILPGRGMPAIVHFKKSPLCTISVKKRFEEVDKNVYVNPEYQADADNLMTFVLDVAVGNITFEYKE